MEMLEIHFGNTCQEGIAVVQSADNESLE